MHVGVISGVALLRRGEEQACETAGNLGKAVLDEAVEPASFFEIRERYEIGAVMNEFTFFATKGGAIGEPVTDGGMVARGSSFVRGEGLDAFDDVDCVEVESVSRAVLRKQQQIRKEGSANHIL